MSRRNWSPPSTQQSNSPLPSNTTRKACRLDSTANVVLVGTNSFNVSFTIPATSAHRVIPGALRTPILAPVASPEGAPGLRPTSVLGGCDCGAWEIRAGWPNRRIGWPGGGVTAHNQGFHGAPACAGMRRSSTGSTRAGRIGQSLPRRPPRERSTALSTALRQALAGGLARKRCRRRGNGAAFSHGQAGRYTGARQAR